VVSLVCMCCSWFILAPRVLQLCTNHLALVLCRSMWVSETCQLFLIPSRSSSTPLYPLKVLRTRERGPTLYSSAIFSLGFTFESSRSWECVINNCIRLGVFSLLLWPSTSSKVVRVNNISKGILSILDSLKHLTSNNGRWGKS